MIGKNISVIIAVKNSASTLHRCLASVLAQKKKGFEIIVMDGGSTDGTLSIIQNYRDDLAHFESKQDNGIYNAWNDALDHAKGKWIVFLGADDFLYDGKVFENISPHLECAEKSKIYWVYANYALYFPDGTLLAIKRKPWKKYGKKFFGLNQIVHTGSYHHKDLFTKYGKFDESFKIAGDYELLLRAIKHREPYYAEDVVAVGMTIGGISRDLESRFTALRECARARSRHVKGFCYRIFLLLYAILIFRLFSFFFGKKASYLTADIVRGCFGKERIWMELLDSEKEL